jgi:hypothetical protein
MMQKVVACFGLDVRAIQAVVAEHVMITGPFPKVQGTNKHAIMLVSRQHLKVISETVKINYSVRARVACFGLKSAGL